MNADDDDIALGVELRQLLDAVELALEATGSPLRVLESERARGDLSRREVVRSHSYGRVEAGTGATNVFERRPLAQEDDWSASGFLDCEISEATCKPMMRFVTLLAMADIPIALSVSNEDASSTGDGRVFSEGVFSPKLNFHFDGFFVTTGDAWTTDTGRGKSGATEKSPRCFDDKRDALLIS